MNFIDPLNLSYEIKEGALAMKDLMVKPTSQALT